MSAGKAIFVTGIVIGTTTGFSLGHLALWGRCSVPRPAAAQSEPQSPVADLHPALSEIDPWNPLDAMSPSSEVFYSTVADARESSADEPNPVDVSLPSESPTPPSFLPPPDASPLDVEIDFDLRDAIEREVPDASAEQLEVWLDVLQGLNEEDAVGILRMWQLHGGESPPSMTAELVPLESEPPSFEFDRDPLSRSDAEREVLAHLREITLHNIANALTPGYRSLSPVVSNLAFQSTDGEPSSDYGIRLERVTLSIDDGPLIETGEQWDVAIRHQPCVFFKLLDAGEVALTRYGHFETDDQHRLCIAANGRSWPLDPPVTLPSGAARIRIELDGRVLARTSDDDSFAEVGRIEPCQVHSPQSLEPMGDRLYRVTEPLSVSSPSEPFDLAQGFIEGSNVSLTVERDRLAWLDELSLLRP